MNRLIQMGLNRKKAKAVYLFRAKYNKSPEYYENWKKISYDKLKEQVSNEYCLRTWSASMLSIFHFGNTDFSRKRRVNRKSPYDCIPKR